MYKLTHRIYSKFKLSGFRLKDEDGNESIMAIDKAMDLFREGQIENFKVIKDDKGEEHIVGTVNRLYDIPIDTTKGTLKVRGRILDDDGKVVGYKVYSELSDKEINISKEKMWELAFYKKVVGISAYVNEYKNGDKEEIKRILISD